MNDRASPEQMTSVRAALSDAAFAGISSAAPLLVIMGEPPRIIHASPAALSLFGTHDVSALEARCLGGREPGARRLHELARTLTPGAPPRLERLRFFLGGAATPLTMLCRRTAGDNPLFIAAATAARAVMAPAQETQQQALETQPPASPPEAATGAAQSTVQASSSAPEQAADPELALHDPSADGLASRGAKLQHSGSVRFLWATNADHQFSRLNGALCDTLGCETSALIGASFLDFARRPGFDPEGRLQAALGARETWSGVEVWWPFAHSDEVAPVTLGGLPTFDRDADGNRVFAGFSGFGVIHLSRVKARAADEAARPDEHAASPPSQTSQVRESDVSPLVGHEESDALDEPETPPPSPIAMIRSKLMSANVVALDAWKTGAAQESERVNERRARIGDLTPDLPGSDDKSPTPPLPASSNDGLGRVAPRTTDESVALSMSERTAFREIARALGARLEGSDAPRFERRSTRLPDHDDASANAPATAGEPPVGETAGSEVPAGEVPACEVPAGELPPRIAEAAGLMALAARLVDRIDLGLLVCRGGEAVYLNRPLADMLGYPDPEAFIAQEGLHHMFRGRSPETANAESSDGLLHVLTRGGETLALEARLQTIDWSDGPATLISMRRSAEQELAARVRALEATIRKREDEASELHAILDTATDGVIVLDSTGRILALNRSAEALFGYEQNEVAGETFSILFAGESQAAAQEYLAGLQGAGVNSLLNDGREVIGRARQGGQMPMFMTLGRIGRDGERFCAVLRDVTQWKNAERELKDARREAERTSALKSDFLAKISHEVRTPLNAILGFAEVMGDERFGPLGNERYKDYLKDIHSSGSHVLSLINDLLDLSKIEAGRMDLDFDEVDANQIVSECVSIMQSQAIRERVILRLSLAPRLPHVTADARSLRQIVLNILSNAVKFNQPAGQVIVSTALTDAGAAVIRVRDTGIGMDEREIETALEPFRQIQTSRQTTGTGLGLPLTKALVEANRASFTIRSRKGDGTLVEVAFPSSRVLAE